MSKCRKTAYAIALFVAIEAGDRFRVRSTGRSLPLSHPRLGPSPRLRLIGHGSRRSLGRQGESGRLGGPAARRPGRRLHGPERFRSGRQRPVARLRRRRLAGPVHSKTLRRLERLGGIRQHPLLDDLPSLRHRREPTRRYSKGPLSRLLRRRRPRPLPWATTAGARAWTSGSCSCLGIAASSRTCDGAPSFRASASPIATPSIPSRYRAACGPT